jgi:uncharacterized DUF497 family protein
MGWTWDPIKAATNRRKHGVSFEVAAFVFGDPLILSQPDPHPDGDRWQSLGAVGGVVLFVVHTWPDDESDGRIISARRATPHERRNYEEGE